MHGGGNAGALTWGSTNDQAGRSLLGAQRPHVVMDRDAGKALGEELAAARLGLAELDGSESACGFEADGVTANAGKEVEDMDSHAE